LAAVEAASLGAVREAFEDGGGAPEAEAGGASSVEVADLCRSFGDLVGEAEAASMKEEVHA